MRVIVIGGGKVGDSLAFHLTREGCDVVVIDHNLKTLEKMMHSYDIIGIYGNGASPEILEEAGVDQADMLIAVTSSDEINALCCVMGKQLGAQYTIARIRQPEFGKKFMTMNKDVGVDMLINPDQEAARFIIRTLKFTSSLHVESFAKGRVNLVEFELNHGNPLIGQKVSDVPQFLQFHILACCVTRKDEVFIPSGNFMFEERDRLYVTGSTNELSAFFRSIGKEDSKIKDVMIIGGGPISYYVAQQLEHMHIRVRIIEINEHRASSLSKLIPQSIVIHGDGADPELLDEEQLDMMDACISLTGIDEENIIISLYANTKKVKKVITKVNRRGFVRMISNVGVGSIVTPKELMVNQIVRYVRAKINSQGSNVQTLYRIVDNRVEALEFKAVEHADFLNIPIMDLEIKPGIMLAYIIRNGRILFPRGKDKIFAMDHVIVITSEKFLSDLQDIFI